MTDHQKRDQLLDFLDKKAFDPILRASPDRFDTQHQREMFEDVRRSTESEKRRFHDNYPSAHDVKSNYVSDLSSKTARKKNSELEQLGLPRLPELKDEFLSLCKKLSV